MSNIKSKLVLTCLKKQDLQREYDLLKEKSDTIKNELQNLKNTPEVKEFVISLLGDGPRLSEDNQRLLDHPMKIVTDGSETVAPIDLASKYFNPNEDDWEFVGIEENTDHQYRIQIEAVKNRSYIGAGTYIMDTFWTPWFKLVDKTYKYEKNNSTD